jgi:cytochrome bd-type quinol oxidase subunit 2
LALGNYKNYNAKVQRYINPIWEVDSTFAVFYLVNFEATFPKLLSLSGTLYVAPLLISFIFLMGRNAAMAYSEYIESHRLEEDYIRLYALCTLIALFLIISVFNSTISGIGVNLSSASLNFVKFFLNPFNLLMVSAFLIFSVYVTSNYFNEYTFRRCNFMLMLIGISVVYLALAIYLPYILTNAVRYAIISIPFAAISIFVLYLSISMNKKRSLAAVVWFAIAVLFFELLQYPYIFGNLVPTTNYLTNSASGQGIAMITAIGGAILVASLSYFIYIAYVKKEKKISIKGRKK